jgi:uncharacterized protein
MNSNGPIELPSQRIAVIGGGVAGIVCSYLLQREHQVTLFEQNSYLGGHTNTIDIPNGPDAGTPVDTGFIVLNDQNYPNFHRFLSRLSVDVRYSCMSFGYFCEKTGFCYAGTDLNGLFAERRNIISPSFWSMLLEIWQFCQESLKALERGSLAGLSLGEFLAQGRHSKFFQDHYLLPISSAIWSAGDEKISEFPAEMFVRFFKNHGLLSIRNRPRWQTVVGGSQSYVRAFLKAYSGAVRLNSPVREVRRIADGVNVTCHNGEVEQFDKVVLASHADQTLKLMGDPSPAELEAFSAWTYSRNRTVLHTNAEILPPLKRAWASWNYRRVDQGDDPSSVMVTYHMNRLQGLNTAREYCVTLNPSREVPKSSIIREIEYTHPVYSRKSFDSQEKIRALNGTRNTYYCGAYLGSGFHEDAVSSALEVAKAFGQKL